MQAGRLRYESWSPWQPLVGIPAISADVLAETLDGGQAFRWNRQPDGTWLGAWSEHVVRLRLGASERIEWSAPNHATAATADALANYFATDRDFAALADTLPWRSDPHLARCIISFSGLRILRQPFGETLLGFLCSATKQIVQIKQMLALLAERHGAPLFAPSTLNPRLSTPLHHLPTWPELAQIPETDLRACLLGFRARYIAETARFLAAHPGWLEETETASYPIAKERLCSLAGVGEKVADCVLLFGAGRLEAFPVDVWILKTLARRYGLDGWRPPQLVQFGRAHFGPLAGLAQQYLFAWEREERRRQAPPNARRATLNA
jgi:N-glycosylase/DNA lyase